ncbi:exodeoxyribonuclease VII large subunit [Pleomorphovibrio marinus]|uniref:exodeoxyribonuclease VII large subunit n=1 Tax=Pleomorphovibrio marinus TaxID=2164132 RepID=UPI000E0A577B|nr:exodeoxyribonuclease VII large subunit [Pleomorphovibrio marinus]
MQNSLRLFELNALIKTTLDLHLDPGYWVVAEIGEFRDSVRGHAYLDLVEKEEGQLLAKLRANIWSYTYQGIRRKFESVTGEQLKAGMNILCLVSVQFHEIYGLSLNIKDIDPSYTLGERARRRQEVIDRLKKEGLLELNRQFLLPLVPQRIAVISSVTAAGYGDFINQLDQNPYGFKISHKLYQASMQGKETPSSITKAISLVEKDMVTHGFDLLVIIRGGGAQTDMDSFDDYELAKSIAEAALPVVTGIGHERDESVADLVAHTQMKTPTAVAAFILTGFKDFEDKLKMSLNRMERACRNRWQREKEALSGKEFLLLRLFSGVLSEQKDRIDTHKLRVASVAKYALKYQLLQIQGVEKGIKKSVGDFLHQEQVRLLHLQNNLKLSDPVGILQKGYTRTEFEGKPLHRHSPRPGDEIITFTNKEKINSKITRVNEYEIEPAYRTGRHNENVTRGDD